MARYNLIEIDGIFITGSGLVGGMRCRTEVSGLVALRPANRKIIGEASDGTPKVQFRSHKGRPIGIVIASPNKDLLDDLIVAIDAQDASDPHAHNVVIEGDTGDFDLDCVIANIDAPGTFSNGVVNQITLDLRVHTVNAITAGS